MLSKQKTFTLTKVSTLFLQMHFNLRGNHKAQCTRNTIPLSASQFVPCLPHVSVFTVDENIKNSETNTHCFSHDLNYCHQHSLMMKAKYMFLDTNKKIMKQLKINKWHNLEKQNGTGFNTVTEWALTNPRRILTYKLQETEISENLKITIGFWFYSVITKIDLSTPNTGQDYYYYYY